MRRSLPVLFLPLLVACSATSDGDGSGGAGGGACVEPPSQMLSQPCCLAHGVDACGATLFCAAFDGRTQPTCYLEHSRLDGQECDADLHCVSNSCNTAERKCRATPWAQCTPAVGCATDASGDRHACVDDGDGPRCQRVGDGSYDAVCLADADCTDLVCRNGRCTFDLACDLPGDGTGPCVEYPDGAACTACIQNAVYACYAGCGATANSFGACASGSGCSDATCLLDTCADEFCGFFACAAETCDTAVDCF